jgi:hypothetical protein
VRRPKRRARFDATVQHAEVIRRTLEDGPNDVSTFLTAEAFREHDAELSTAMRELYDDAYALVTTQCVDIGSGSYARVYPCSTWRLQQIARLPLVVRIADDRVYPHAKVKLHWSRQLATNAVGDGATKHTVMYNTTAMHLLMLSLCTRLYQHGITPHVPLTLLHTGARHGDNENRVMLVSLMERYTPLDTVVPNLSRRMSIASFIQAIDEWTISGLHTLWICAQLGIRHRDVTINNLMLHRTASLGASYDKGDAKTLRFVRYHCPDSNEVYTVRANGWLLKLVDFDLASIECEQTLVYSFDLDERLASGDTSGVHTPTRKRRLSDLSSDDDDECMNRYDPFLCYGIRRSSPAAVDVYMFLCTMLFVLLNKSHYGTGLPLEALEAHSVLWRIANECLFPLSQQIKRPDAWPLLDFETSGGDDQFHTHWMALRMPSSAHQVSATQLLALRSGYLDRLLARTPIDLSPTHLLPHYFGRYTHVPTAAKKHNTLCVAAPDRQVLRDLLSAASLRTRSTPMHTAAAFESHTSDP